jgi:hypothetical protein
MGNLSSVPLHNIIERANLLSTARLTRGMHGMRRGIRQHPELPFGLPALLHSDLETWPFDRDEKVKVIFA